jgi:pyruvate kinase
VAKLKKGKSNLASDGFSLSSCDPKDRRAKIICTIGPSSNDEEMLGALMRAGMDVARLNFSHGTHDKHAATIRSLREIAAAEDRTICIMQDLQGPKIRTGLLRDHKPVTLKGGSVVRITTRDIEGTEELISTTFQDLPREIQPGGRILLCDGLIELKVISVSDDEVECTVVNGGVLGEHKGINLPGVALSIPALTPKDKDDLDFGLKSGVDAVALSFVRSAEDIHLVKKIMQSHGIIVPVIAKLEKPQALEHLEEILDAADSVMVARGDLGVEMPPEQVPVIQKHVIKRAAEWRKPVIIATQMLESMIENPRPTRAEASDVANAIFDGTDAVMLSGETASGRYPREAVAMMVRIVLQAESSMEELEAPKRRRDGRALSIAETICESVAHAAEDLHMEAIASFTDTGTTVRLISKYRPKAAIYGFSHSARVCNRMNLLWGVYPLQHPPAQTVEAMVSAAEQALLKRGLLKTGDVVGVVGGTKMSTGSTNFMRLHVIAKEEAKIFGRKNPY